MAPRKGRNLRDDERFTEVVNQFAGGYKTIGQMVYTVLREAIVSGAFVPGEWLRQEAIAEAVGVSRIPVRTALLQLEAEGLVTFNPHRGARVRTLSPSQIEEIYRLRLLLEPHALALSMPRLRPERLKRMRDLATQLDNAPEGIDVIDARVQFYREVYDAANNPLLVEMIEELRGRVGRYLLSFRAGRHQNTHGELVDNIEAGDLMAAQSWLRAHIDEVRATIIDLAREAEEDVDDERAAEAAGPDVTASGGEPGSPHSRRQAAKVADVSKIAAIR
ncbi:MAG: hypothetical protein JWM19_468 [Actinomycetia bacterium]|nr:hypothetical protein [Actinomycetes bacterium]